MCQAVIVSVQAGNVNSGAFESVPATADLLAGRNSWLHVDEAFGLWAAATPRLRPVVEGIEWADSWATDAHKWLNVPYDSGIVIVRRPADHQGLKTARCAYAGQASETQRDGSTWVPENSRRARAFALYAGLRALGRSGVQLLVECSVALAQRFAAQAARLPFATIANQVVLNQVLVRFEPPGEYDRDILHAALASEFQREGTCWIGAGRWRGHAVLRVSVSTRSRGGEGLRRSSHARPQPTNGSMMRTPAFTKSARFRVATARPWTRAVAAMRLSLMGMAFPVVRRRASSSAHFSPV